MTEKIKAMSRSRTLVLGVALCCVLLPCAVRAESVLQAPSGSNAWWLQSADGETCVSDRAASLEWCWTSAARMTDLRETAEGWIAAGRQPDAIGGGLTLLRQHGKDVKTLLAPPASGLPQGRPQLVTDDVSLLGLIWLEGETQDSLAVRAAVWQGDGWGEATTVSPPETGSQVAPQVTVLADGRWLLLWSSFDGTDDETVWSVFDGRRWSPPTRVHEDNDSPDILPAVIATRRGAIAAWSWLDGRDYRLRTAFFDGKAWRVGPVSGGRGSLEARLFATAGTYLLRFESVVPEEWVVWELDELGRPIRRASHPRQQVKRPLVDFVGSGASLRWPEVDGMREVVAAWEAEQ